MIDGYVRLPITDRTTTWHMENWLGPLRRWYNSDVSTVDYAALGSDHADDAGKTSRDARIELDLLQSKF
jgi:hypothetical protein